MDASCKVTAVVLTHRRPRLATQTIEALIEAEGWGTEDILLVINGEGGLDNSSLEHQLETLRLSENLGPGEGFRVGIEHVMATRASPWLYLLEDDVGLLDLPPGRVARIIKETESSCEHGADIGAVVAYGRVFAGNSGRTVPHVPSRDGEGYSAVDVAAWGASLVRREVFEEGVLPDGGLFFGYEDFDFFLRLQRQGWRLVVDLLSERAVFDQVTSVGRQRTFGGARPTDQAEIWREYYRARNFLIIRERWGSARWTADHLLRSIRRWQLTGWSGPVGLAIFRGLKDGLRGKLGPSRRYQRHLGEFSQ